MKAKENNSSLRERVYSELRMDILSGRINPGARLVESALAKDMGVSRTPVREALHKLALEGLLYSIPRAGYIVEEMTERDIEDLFQTRMAIEQLAGRWAMVRVTEEELDSMKGNLQKTDDALKSGKTEKMIELDKEFHHILYKACRSKRLYQICKNLSDHTLKFRIACIHFPEIARRAREGHSKIYRALKSKQPDRIDESIEYHMNVTKEDILAFLRQVRDEAFMAQEAEF